jgi:hypothetical protein
MKPVIDTVVSSVTKITHKAELNSNDLKNYLGLPANARLYFHVPGGGDWSNGDVDISKDNPIHISWTEVG